MGILFRVNSLIALRRSLAAEAKRRAGRPAKGPPWRSAGQLLQTIASAGLTA